MKTILHPSVPGMLFRTTAFAALLLAASCSKSDVPEENPVPVPGKTTIHASTEATRTALGDNHSVVWSDGDSFRLFSDLDTDGQPFVLTEGAGTTGGTFTGIKPVGNTFVAVFPDSETEYLPTGPKITMPASQKYTEGTFAAKSNPMIAYSDAPENLSFTNLCGVIELQITGTGTLSAIELHSADYPLCGKGQVFTDGEHFLLQAPGGSGVLHMENIGKALSADTPTSFYFVVPPATFTGLQVVMRDNLGNETVRTASKPVDVVRGHIVPLEGLVMDDPATDPAVMISIDTELSSPFHTYVTYTMDPVRCDSYLVIATAKSVIDDYFINNPDNTLKDYLLDQGTLYEDTFIANYRNQPEMEIVLAALPMKEGSVVHDPVRVDYTSPSITIDPALGAAIDITAGETDMTASVNASGSPLEIYYQIYLQEIYDLNDPQTLYSDMLEYGPRLDITGNPTELFIDQLLPNTAYVLGVVLRSKVGFTTAFWQPFTTEVHQTGNATLSITAKEIGDFRASFDFVIAGGSTYKAAVYKGTPDNLNLDEIPGYVAQTEMRLQPTLTFDLQPETTYTVCGIAYDSEGVYGELSYLTFSTKSPLPGEDSEDYRRMLGSWRMFYDNFESTAHTDLTVTITEEAVGNTYLISGLLSQAARDKYGIDDTVRARFINGQLILESGSPVANPGVLSTHYNVLLTMINGNNQLWADPQWKLRGTYTDGRIQFAGDPSEVVGYIFYAFSKDTSNSGSVENLVPTNITLEKIVAEVGNGQTEGFNYDTPSNPGWR